jgi:hypothetical protein
MSRKAITEIDQTLASLREEITCLEKARGILVGGSKPSPLPKAPAAGRRGEGVAGDPVCSGIELSPCGGRLLESTCRICGVTIYRCENHGGKRTAGGLISKHRRDECRGDPELKAD